MRRDTSRIMLSLNRFPLTKSDQESVASALRKRHARFAQLLWRNCIFCQLDFACKIFKHAPCVESDFRGRNRNSSHVGNKALGIQCWHHPAQCLFFVWMLLHRIAKRPHRPAGNSQRLDDAASVMLPSWSLSPSVRTRSGRSSWQSTLRNIVPSQRQRCLILPVIRLSDEMPSLLAQRLHAATIATIVNYSCTITSPRLLCINVQQSCSCVHRCSFALDKLWECVLAFPRSHRRA